jgi:hypothetical protein
MKGFVMKRIKNEKGIALVTALMFTALSLAICMSLLYMITAGVQTSGALKRYRTAMDATNGGTEITVKDLINASFGFKDYSSATKTFPTYLKGEMGTLAAGANVSDCMRERLTTPKRLWSVACADPDLNPKNGPDVSFQLNAVAGAPYTVYSKIVDTMERRFLVLDDSGVANTVIIAGNSDTSTYSLEGGGTTEGGMVTVPHYPYVYRIEVQGEKQQNSLEKGVVSVIYAY